MNFLKKIIINRKKKNLIKKKEKLEKRKIQKIDNLLRMYQGMYGMIKYLINHNNITDALKMYKTVQEFRIKIEKEKNKFNKEQLLIFNSMPKDYKEYIDKINNYINE